MKRVLRRDQVEGVEKFEKFRNLVKCLPVRYAAWNVLVGIPERSDWLSEKTSVVVSGRD